MNRILLVIKKFYQVVKLFYFKDISSIEFIGINVLSIVIRSLVVLPTKV